MIGYFVDIDGIADHHHLNFLFIIFCLLHPVDCKQKRFATKHTKHKIQILFLTNFLKQQFFLVI